MIKFFCGKDDFESYVEAKKYIKNLASVDSASYNILESENITNLSELTQQLEGQDLFATTNFLLLKRPESNKIIAEYLINNIDRLEQLNLTLWSDISLDKRSVIYKRFKDKKCIVEFELPKPAGMNIWLNTVAKIHNIKISNEQSKYILERFENKWQIYSLIKKIQNYLFNTDKDKISLEELKHIDGTALRGDIWKLTDAFTKSEFQVFIQEFKKLMESEDQSQLVIAMLGKHLDNLIKLKYSENILSKPDLGIHPFVVSKIRPFIKNFSEEDLEAMVYELFLADRSIKFGHLSPVTAVLSFAYNIVHNNTLSSAYQEEYA